MKNFIIALALGFSIAGAPLCVEAASASGTAAGTGANTAIGHKQTSEKYLKGKTSVHKKTSSDNATTTTTVDE